MELIIKGKLIDTPIPVILETIRKETGYKYYRNVKSSNSNNYSVTCPFHKGGQENNPSCQVLSDSGDEKTEYGYHYCFTCGAKMRLHQVVAHCFEESEEFGQDWLVERFGHTFVQYQDVLTDIVLSKPKEQFLDESVLDNFNYYHPYMWERGLSKDVVDRYQVGFNPKTQSLTFPIRDVKGRLKMITERSVHSKNFYIQKDIEKPVYLLNYVLQDGYKTVFVCESQINALTLQGWGYPAVALIGTGTPKQMEILNKSGLRTYYLVFDGDEAGDRGVEKFKKSIRKDVIVNVIKVPRGKDVNDLTKEEFENLQVT